MLEGDLIVELHNLFTAQEEAYEVWEKRVVLFAEAEKDYQIGMRKRALIEKDEGTPATFINQFIRGDEYIAELRKQRDIAEALAEISKNKVTDLRKRIEVANAQAGREWAVRDNNVSAPAPWLE